MNRISSLDHQTNITDQIHNPIILISYIYARSIIYFRINLYDPSNLHNLFDKHFSILIGFNFPIYYNKKNPYFATMLSYFLFNCLFFKNPFPYYS